MINLVFKNYKEIILTEKIDHSFNDLHLLYHFYNLDYDFYIGNITLSPSVDNSRLGCIFEYKAFFSEFKIDIFQNYHNCVYVDDHNEILFDPVTLKGVNFFSMQQVRWFLPIYYDKPGF